MRRKNTIDEFTDRAIRATEAGKLIPPIVYLPSRLRGHNTRLTVDQVRITMDPPTVQENHVRIAEADPIGFLNALMHGQPIPAFEITPEGSLKIRYEVADLAMRRDVAKFLAHKVTLRTPEGHTKNNPASEDPEGWDDIVTKRTEAERTKANGL